ncbi:type II toxin-antitoxin system VapB family antitoxin [Nocardia farcinica]|uniref:type II toxin-antitoxin system VapB family antitoxin n=1 Tax=Nocardia farcinica TaxID=37329 RepID=UPI0039817420
MTVTTSPNSPDRPRTKTLIDIPDELMEQARQITGGAMKTETVRTALRLLVGQHRSRFDRTTLARRLDHTTGGTRRRGGPGGVRTHRTSIASASPLPREERHQQ